MANASPSEEEITIDPHTSIDVEGLVTSMRGKIEKLPHLSPNCCIYRVPQRLREVNEKAYTPRVVSIGPLHHGKQGLEAMEEHKWRYLRDFLEHGQKPIGEFVEFIREREERIRECYAESVNLNSVEFVEIVLLDAAFIIEIFLRRYGTTKPISGDDRICGKPRMFRDIRSDLLLLENQIPFFVLEGLFLMANIKETLTFMELTCKFVADTVPLTNINRPDQQEIDSSKVEHLIDFLRSCLLPRESILAQQLTESKFDSIRTATELHEAGVKFEVSSSENLFDIEFSHGVLKVPRIKITDNAERYLRNLIAFEQCHYIGGFICDYVAIMDNLINTSKDVEFLVQSRVIENWLGDSQDVSNLFNNLSNQNLINSDNFYFGEICRELNGHCRIRWNRWKATLRHDYFGTPWQVLSIVVAAILLLLTFIQTVCSIISI